MVEKVYVNLLLLCGILSQGIIGRAHENIKEPSDIPIRQKRVISFIPGEDRKEWMSNAGFIVKIKEELRIKCVGSILSYHVVITINKCVPLSNYQVSSGSSHSDYGTVHNVTSIRRHFGNHPHISEDGVALLTVFPYFQYARSTTPIRLHSAPLLPGTHGTVFGWGYNSRQPERGTEHPRNLRSIEVPILAHRDCVNIYRPHGIEISDTDVCTYHPQRHCGHTDGGAPLVVDGLLAGIHLWTGPNGNQISCEYPDVFVILQHSAYKQWIVSNVNNIGEHLRNV